MSERRLARRANLERLLNPRHIAFIGGRTCIPAIEMARAARFGGDIWVVHPSYETLAGEPVYSSIEDLPAAPDAAFLNISKRNTLDVVGRLAERGAGGAVCFAAGFAEVGAGGREQQDELEQRCGDLALIGPNSTGFLNYFDNVALWPVADHEAYRLDSGVAVLSSSGGMLFNYSVNQRSLRAGLMIGVGNQAVLDFSDYLQVLAGDKRVTAIGLIIEELGDVIAFSQSAAGALAHRKPVVVLKTGASEVGGRVAQTHSGALVADDQMVQALMDRVGAIAVNSLPELDETLKMLTTTTRPKGRRVAVLTNSGGEKALAADAAADTVLEFPPPSAAVAKNLASQIPEFAMVSNPFDYNAYFSVAGPDVLSADNPHLLTRCFKTMLEDHYDIAIMLNSFRTHPDGSVEEEGNQLQPWIDAVRGTGVAAVMASVLPEHMPPVYGSKLIANGVAPLQGLGEAMRAVHHAILWEERVGRIGKQAATDLALWEVSPGAGKQRLENEYTAKGALSAYGLVTPPACPANAADVVSAAESIGYPVVVKALEPVIAHKAKAGAVVLNLTRADQVIDAVKAIDANLEKNRTRLDQVLVERMVTDPVIELIAGIKFDPRFGHALVFGRGGVAVELIKDLRTMLLPVGEQEIERLVASTSVTRELSEPALQGVVDALMAIVTFVEERRDDVSALDVNPLIVTATGNVVAVDVLLEVNEEMSR